MPRYKGQVKKGGAWRVLHPGARIAVIVLGTIVTIALVTLLAKKLFSNLLPVSGGTVHNELLSKGALVSKVSELQTTIDSYNADISTVSQLRAENEALKAELGRPQESKGTLAHVLTLPNRSFYDTMLIDAGTAEGVKENAIVYAFGSVALGTVSSVNAHSATVQLYSSPGRQTSGTASGSDVAVTLIGRGGGEYEVQLPRDVPFSVGSNVELQSVVPATLATIEKIVTDPRDPFQRLLAKVPVNLQALKWVIVK